MQGSDFKEWLIYEDDHYMAINKPVGISSLDERHEAGPPSVLRRAKDYYADAQLCHRLDKETSGVLLLAKHPDAYRNAAIQFEDRQVGKIYHAVVNGVHRFEAVNVYMPILPLKTGGGTIDTKNGKPAETFFDTIKAYKAHTLVAAVPVTGRIHQIRIHLAYLRAPIVGDRQYGGRDIYLSSIKRRFNLKKNTDELPLIQRVALHAKQLRLDNVTGEELALDAPYPKDYAALVNQLERNS